MLNEPASSLDDNTPLRRINLIEPEESLERDPRYTEIRDAVEMVMTIHSEDFHIDSDERREQQQSLFMLSRESRLLMTFRGQLTRNSEAAYDQLDSLFKAQNLLPIFRQGKKGEHVIYIVEGRARPTSGGITMSIVLFIATVFSVLFVGTGMAIGMGTVTALPLPELIRNLWRGLPYASSILLILGAHELGHYFMARRHNTAASLPYFLPFPFGLFGTFGAAIRLREPMRNRKVLMDIGAAGPLAGLVFAIPILLIGLATSEVITIPAGAVYIQEGNSVLYALSKAVVFGQFLPNGGMDVDVNQLTWAGWTGLLVTGLNLIPVGQLDGGHVLYSLLGKLAKRLYYPIVGLLLLLTVFVAQELLVFVMLILLFGNMHAAPLDDITPLDPRRRSVAAFTLMVFFLVFAPQPIQTVTMEEIPVEGELVYLPVVMMTLWLARERLWHGARALVARVR